MQNPKILFIASSSKIGLTNSFVDLLKTLKKKCNVDVLTWDKEQDNGLFEMLYGLKVKIFVSPVLEKKNLISFFKVLRYFNDLVEENSYDIVHCNTQWHVFLARTAYLILKLKGKNHRFRIVSTMHTFYQRRNFIRFIHKYLSDRVLVLSKFESDQVKIRHSSIWHWGVSPVCVDHGSPNEEILLRKVGLDKKLFKVLVVANFKRHKGYNEILNVVFSLKNDCHFIFLGSYGELKNKVERFLERNSVSYFLGRVEKKYMNLIYSSCDIFLFMSKEETFGLSLLEALSNKLPVIATQVGIAPELIKNGFNGYLVQSSAEAIIKIREVMNGSISEDNMSLSKKIIENQFSWENSAESLVSIYNEEFTEGNNERTTKNE